MIVADLLREAAQHFREAKAQSDRRDAALLLGELLGKSEAWVRAFDDVEVPAEVVRRFRELVARRASGEPFAYLVGRREFWGRSFRVDDRVLVPRPETEHAVEAVLGLELPPRPVILDLGVGSGVLALTLAAEVPGARVVGVDLSVGAAAVAALNASRLGLEERVAMLVGDLTRALRLASFDLVVSNPPYLDRESEEVQASVRRYEPDGALFAEACGTAVLDRILGEGEALRPGTPLVVELGYDQREWWLGEIERRSAWEAGEVRPDLAGLPRIGLARRGAGGLGD